jgi:hypothetical protein
MIMVTLLDKSGQIKYQNKSIEMIFDSYKAMALERLRKESPELKATEVIAKESTDTANKTAVNK